MKNNIIFVIILFISACSSLPKVEKSQSLNTLIQKPDFNYKIKSLPKSIKVYFSQTDEKSNLPLEVQGFIANAYTYKNKISYKPKISFSNFKAEECGNAGINEDLIIVLDFEDSSSDVRKEECLGILPKSKTLYVSNNGNDFGFTNTFTTSREEEENQIIDHLSNSSKRIILIDSKKTLDKEKIRKSLQEIKKEVVASETYNSDLSSQDMFAKLLLVNRSQDRKRKLSRRISEPLKSDTRIREDIDTFFLSVDIQEARNLKPALDYISEKDFEVYVLNSWQTNGAYKLEDKDLVGSIHSDFPIMMPIKIPEIINEKVRSREFAIGYDLFEVILLKYGGVDYRNYQYKGLSGKIVLRDNKVKRTAYLFKITDKGLKIL
tara:strand:+ start:1545 stop:2675 length:1131 start_codon:yes stop_codon:yes gene_type:complete